MITVLIPTISSERIQTLFQAVISIQAGKYRDTHVVIISDGNLHIYKEAKKTLRNVSVILNKERMGWPATINKMVKELNSECFAYASDDLIFPSDCLHCALHTMRRRFPDGDGVVTLGKKNRCAFGLFGSKFADRFPDRQIFCPDYFHYGGDSELYRTLMSLNRFAYPPKRDSQVQHSRLKDGSWIMARKKRTKDLAMYKLRAEKGFSWGIDFNLITREKTSSENDSKRRSLEGEGSSERISYDSRHEGFE